MPTNSCWARNWRRAGYCKDVLIILDECILYTWRTSEIWPPLVSGWTGKKLDAISCNKQTSWWCERNHFDSSCTDRGKVPFSARGRLLAYSCMSLHKALRLQKHSTWVPFWLHCVLALFGKLLQPTIFASVLYTISTKFPNPVRLSLCIINIIYVI